MQKIIEHKVWGKYLRTIFISIVILSFGLLLKRFWIEIESIQWRFDPRNLLMSILFTVLAILGWSAIWSWLLNRLSHRTASLENGISVYLYGNLTKYIPGFLWNYVTRGYIGYKLGYQPQIIWLGSFIELIGSISTGLGIYSLSLILPHVRQPIVPISILLLILIFFLGAMSPPILKLIVTWLQNHSLLDKNSTTHLDLRWGEYVRYLVFFMMTWIFVGIAFCFFITSIYPVPIKFLPEIIGMWSLSISLGLLVILAPQGVGIREGFLMITLTDLIPFPAALSISILSRFWIIACEILATSIWWVVSTIYHKILPKNY